MHIPATRPPITEIAAAHGWTHTTRAEGKHYSRIDFHRDDESVNLTVWHTHDTIRSGYATLAAGRVARKSTTLRGTSTRYTLDEVTALFTGKRASDYPASPWVAVVEAGEYRDRTAYETASNYNIVRLTSGRYPVELVDMECRRAVAPDQRGDWFLARIPAVIVREYYVCRLLSASSVHDEPVNRPTTAVIRDYPYNLDAAGSYLGGLARIVYAV